jgi:sugar phosphate isomerase/epimerase
MAQADIQFSVFTKPWPAMPLAQLGTMVHGLGFHGIELPVRPGFQVEPQNVAKGLPKAAKELADHDVKIFSVAGPTDEATLAACAEVGISTIRVMASIGKEGYLATEAHVRKEYEALLPLLEKYRVRIGLQNHSGNYICNAMGLRHLMEKFDPRFVGAVWDAAHNALNGEEPELALDIVWSHLCMVNLKNAFWQRKNDPKADIAEWSAFWTTGKQGLASWTRVAKELMRRNYQGVVCLTAEYSEGQKVNEYLAQDIAFAKSLFA